MSGGLFGFLGAIFHLRLPPDEAASSEIKQRWREAIHSSRNENMRAVALARQSHKASDQAYEILSETLKKQEAQQLPRETTIDKLVREMQGRK